MVRLYAVALLTVAVVVACDRVNLTAPTGSTISISIDKSVLPLGGQATVTAVVTESAGTPVHNGTVVTFQTTTGSLDPAEATTMNGVATTTFLAGSASGTATIHAFSGGARTGSGNASSGGVTVRIGAAAAAGNISVSATPSSVSQSGGTVGISAIVFDENSNPLPGVNVQFTTSSGSLNPTTSTTDATGIARTQLTTTQTATVNAVAGAAKGETRIEVSTAPPVQIDIAPSPAVAGVPVAITVSSNTSPGARQIQSVTVDFGDNSSETRFNVNNSAAFTHVYGREGGVIVSATVVDVAGNTGTNSRALVVNRAVTSPGVTVSDPTPAVNTPVGFTLTTSPSTGAPPVVQLEAFIQGTRVFSTNAGNGAFTHTFTAAGTYLVEVKATDSAGSVGTTQLFVVVS